MEYTTDNDTKQTGSAKEVQSLIMSEEEIKKVSDKYVPEGFESQEDYLENVRETHAFDLEADDDNRKAALEDKKFVAGEHWDPMVLEQRAGLPCLTINTVPQFTAQLVGDWRTNRVAVKVIPAEDGDKEVASIRSDLVRSIEQRSRADRVYNDAFESEVQCGDGAFRITVEYANEDVFDQDIFIRPIDDALSVVWDRMSIDPTGRDANHLFIDDVLPKKEFEEKFGKIDSSTLTDQRYSGWCDNGTARVTEHWRMIERMRTLALFEDGFITAIDKDNANDLMEEHGPIIKMRLAPCRYAQMHLVTGFKILAGPYEYKLSRLPIIRMSGRVVTVGEKRVRYGLVRFMKDAVRLRNFWRSVAAEQLGLSPKAQWIATESAVEGKEDAFRKAHLSRDPLLVANDEAIIGQNIQKIDPPQIQMALLNEAQVNTQDIKDVTGIHDASLGIKSNETSGRAIMARQREGDIASITYYDNGNAAVLEAGDVINQLIGQIYDGTRIIRTIGEDETTKLVKINDPMDPQSPNLAIGKYDVAITTGASYTTRRVEAAEAMMEAVQVFPELMSVAGDLIAKAQDWPGAEALAERLRKTVPPQLLSEKEREEAQIDNPENMQMQAQMQEIQQAMEQLVKENESLKADKTIEIEKVKVDQYNAHTTRIKTLAEIAVKDEEFNIADREHQMEIIFHEDEKEMAKKETKVSSSKKPSTQTS